MERLFPCMRRNDQAPRKPEPPDPPFGTTPPKSHSLSLSLSLSPSSPVSCEETPQPPTLPPASTTSLTVAQLSAVTLSSLCECPELKSSWPTLRKCWERL